MPSAVHKVLLFVPECLETVLLELDQRTLLTLAQRVCKTWHDKIHTSPSLRKKLFLQPLSKILPSEPDSEARTVNPLLAEVFPAFFASLVPPNLGNRVSASAALIPPKDRFLRRGASWRAMLVEYPIRRKIGYIENRGMCEQSYYSGVLEVPEGATMGKLYDLAYSKALGSQPTRDTCFGVYWRQKKDDPPLNSYSYRGGREEIALSQMGGDVNIVVCVNLAGRRPLERAKGPNDLSERHMPKEFEFSNLELCCTNSHDWFG
ncbi:hypothetical protein MKZ38_007485 [Zalerion maritima]|uniref:F-box domain-containing protein n=1 Tax=Zalerion maritima TaxID=339359 RepID=A0AAD5RUS3_9PEZI|nr:hypothetical protein MKZ38_007485 [Zalerion maritima]